MKKEPRIDCPRCSGTGVCCAINTMKGGAINPKDIIDCPLCFPPEAPKLPRPAMFEDDDYPQDSSAVSSVFGETCPECGSVLETSEGLERDYPDCPMCRWRAQ